MATRSFEGTWKTTSDMRLKNVNGEFTGGLDKINQLKTYNYTFKKDKKKAPHVGVMAQELQKVFPDAVTNDDKGFLMIRQDDMFYAMINSIKQLDKLIRGLVNADKLNEQKIKMLEAKNQQLETQNKAFEIRLKKLEKLQTK